ncbi:hypothetical protein TFLX_01884 [Thermoflexales bacterium]|nr:hypothetical protein TFLX_01884 [Thermoflexales bacterium]
MLSQEEVAGFGYQLFEEIINKGNLGAIDHCFTTTCIEHYASPVPLPNGLDVRNYIATLHATFPDIHYTIEDEYAIGGKAMYLVKGHGTMTSEFFGIAPTAKYGTWEEIHITALRDNKAVEHWAIIDFVGMVLSLGILPKPVKTANE